MSNGKITQFNASDKQVMADKVNRWRLAIFGVLVLSALVSVVLVIIEEDERKAGFMWIPFTLTGIVIAFIFMRRMRSLLMDYKRAEKICGEFAVSKTTKFGRETDVYYLVLVVDEKVRHLRVSEQVYASVNVDQVLYVEFSPGANIIFRLSQGNSDIFLN